MFVYERKEKILMVDGHLPDDENAKVLIDLSGEQAKVLINGEDATSGGTPVPPPTPETTTTEEVFKKAVSFGGDKNYTYENPQLQVEGLESGTATISGTFTKIEDKQQVTCWGFPESVEGVVVIKLVIDGIKKGEAEGLEIKVQGDSNAPNVYGQNALDGDNFIYIGLRNDRKTYKITVKASADAKEKVITITNSATVAED